MGLRSMLGLKAEKPKTPESEKVLARISKDQIKRYGQNYAPLTRDLDKLAQQDKSDLLRGRTNADTMQQLGTPAGPGSNGRMAKLAPVAGRALGEGLTAASNANTARQMQLTKATVDTAMGSNESAIDGLGTSARIGSARAINTMQDKLTRGTQNLNMLGTMAGAGAGALGGGGGTTTKNGTFARTSYNHKVGKGGAGSGAFVSEPFVPTPAPYRGAYGW